MRPWGRVRGPCCVPFSPEGSHAAQREAEAPKRGLVLANVRKHVAGRPVTQRGVPGASAGRAPLLSSAVASSPQAQLRLPAPERRPRSPQPEIPAAPAPQEGGRDAMGLLSLCCSVSPGSAGGWCSPLSGGRTALGVPGGLCPCAGTAVLTRPLPLGRAPAVSAGSVSRPRSGPLSPPGPSTCSCARAPGSAGRPHLSGVGCQPPDSLGAGLGDHCAVTGRPPFCLAPASKSTVRSAFPYHFGGAGHRTSSRLTCSVYMGGDGFSFLLENAQLRYDHKSREWRLHEGFISHSPLVPKAWDGGWCPAALAEQTRGHR